MDDPKVGETELGSPVSGAATRPIRQTSESDDVASAGAVRTRHDVVEEWRPKLDAVLAEWQAAMPADAADLWTPGAAYIRKSSARSLVGDAPDVELRNVLSMFAQKRVYVRSDALFFDVESGTDTAPRAAFRLLFERALAGGFKAIGVFVNERLFRNLGQAIEIKRQFRLHGIDVWYSGKFEGDQRNPAAWQLETMQDTAAELHARNTSYYVGTHFEVITRAGRPVGRIPEVYREAARAPSFMGRRGSVLRWEVVEPLGTIVQEGHRRLIAGASLTELAEWSVTTEAKGVTPAGRLMTYRWWRHMLRNPKLAGYHAPTIYTGFKPGKESPPRPGLDERGELVPCLLPALWTLEDHHEILRVLKSRYSAPKRRVTYRTYLLSGVAYDAECGHKLLVRIPPKPSNPHYFMLCREEDPRGPHSRSRRADIVEQELEELISRMSFDSTELRERVESELRRISEDQARATQAFRPNPAIAAARRALADLQRAGMSGMSEEITRRIATLEAEDDRRRDATAEPIVDYRRAMAHLENWRDVWVGADVAKKNELLRAVGLRLFIGPIVAKKRQPAHIVRIEVENGVFALALATALGATPLAFSTEHPYSASNANIRLNVPVSASPRFDTVFEGSGAEVALARPSVAIPPSPHTLPPRPAGEWLTVREYAKQNGVAKQTVQRWVATGRLPAIKIYRGRVLWHFIPVAAGEVETRAA